MLPLAWKPQKYKCITLIISCTTYKFVFLECEWNMTDWKRIETALIASHITERRYSD